MRKILLLIAIFALTAVIALSAGMPLTKADKIKAAVTAALDNYWKAYESKDLEKVMSLTAPDFFGYGTGRDEKAVGIDQLKKQMERDFAQAGSIALQRTIAGFGFSGNVAWTAHDVVFVSQTGKGEVRMEGRMSSVLRKEGGKWLVGHIHFSMPLAGQQEGQSYPAPAQ